MALDKLGGAFKSTAFRLAAMTSAGFLIAAALIVALIFWQTNQVLTGQVLAELKSEMGSFEAEHASRGLEGLTSAIAARSSATSRGLYFLADVTGRKLAGNLSRFPPEVDPASGGVFRYAPDIADPAQHGHLAVAIAQDVGGVKLVVGRDVEDQRAFADKMRKIFLAGFGLLSLAGILGGLAVSRLVLSRIGKITDTSKSIMAGDLARRVPVTGDGDELDDLSNNLNAMLGRIEQLMSSLKEVSDNIAHDLKTPLTRLRNKAESALRDPRGAAAYKEGLEHTLEEADELIKTFNALLLVARLEAGAVDENASDFDLSELVRDVAELYEPVAEVADLELWISAEAPAHVRANRHLIGQAVANLIDNAIKYAAHSGGPGNGGPIEVAVKVHQKMAEVSVGDRGPGIIEQDRQRVLKRFVRLEQSRTRPGTGLGLSLVAAVARLHKGEIRLEDNMPGLRVVLALPQ